MMEISHARLTLVEILPLAFFRRVATGWLRGIVADAWVIVKWLSCGIGRAKRVKVEHGCTATAPLKCGGGRETAMGRRV